jgi:hypothetical protein
MQARQHVALQTQHMRIRCPSPPPPQWLQDNAAALKSPGAPLPLPPLLPACGGRRVGVVGAAFTMFSFASAVAPCFFLLSIFLLPLLLSFCPFWTGALNSQFGCTAPSGRKKKT